MMEVTYIKKPVRLFAEIFDELCHESSLKVLNLRKPQNRE